MRSVSRHFALSLAAHPAHGPGPLRSAALAGWLSNGRLDVTFCLRGGIAAVKLPANTDIPCRRDGLWNETCCELFIAVDGGYLELNFSPSRDWAAYRFDGYRHGRSQIDGIEVQVEPVARLTDELRLHSQARSLGNIDLLSPRIKINAAVIVEDDVGRKSYWACCHPAANPDFHHGDSFVSLAQAAGPPPGDSPVQIGK